MGTELTVTVTGLISGRDYTFEVRAAHSEGEGSPAGIQATPVGAGSLTALSVSPGTPSGGHRPGSLSPAFSSSTYDYTVTVLQSDTHLTFEATTETGYGKQLRIVSDLGYGEFYYGARDMGSSVPGHQVRMRYGENWFRYAVHQGADGTESDGTAEYHYNIRVTRPYPPLKIQGELGPLTHTSWSYVENRTHKLDRYRARGPGHDVDDQTWTLTGDDSGDFTLTRVEEGVTYNGPIGVGFFASQKVAHHVLRFSEPPDYEDPSDADTDNVYNITVQVTEGDETDTLDVTVTVTYVDSDPGTPVHWFSVWDDSVDDPPQDPDTALEVTEGRTLSLSVRPSYAPADRSSIPPRFEVSTEISDESKLTISGPETVINGQGSIFWSSSGNGWQAWQTLRFSAEEDDDANDESVTITFDDRDGKYHDETITFTVAIADNDESGGL